VLSKGEMRAEFADMDVTTENIIRSVTRV